MSQIKKELEKKYLQIICDAHFGKHFCQFYKTKNDLIDILIPYLEAGLKKNEYCLWVTSDMITPEEAIASLKEMPGFEESLEKGQIEILTTNEWYLKNGTFNPQEVLQGWIEKYNLAMSKGFNGMRLTGDTIWLEKDDWVEFTEYEKDVTDALSKLRVIALCTYPLEKCGPEEILDVVSNHHCAIIRRNGNWDVIESPMASDMYLSILENANDAIVICDSNSRIIFWNRRSEEIFEFKKEEIIGKDSKDLVHEAEKNSHEEGLSHFFKTGASTKNKPFEVEGQKKSGGSIPIEVTLTQYESNENRFVIAIIRDITERKRAERQIHSQIEKLQALRNIDMAITASLDLRVTFNIILDQVMTTLRADAVDILVFNCHTLRLEFAAGRGFRTDALQHTSLGMDEGIAGKTAHYARINVRNLAKEPGEFLRSPLISGEGLVTYVSAPLVSKGNVKGVLEVFYRSQIEPSLELLDFAESLALQSAIAIDNASMFNDLAKANMDLKLAYESTIEGWSRALDLRDKETEGHSQRVTELTIRIARELGIRDENLVHIRRGALLHDIGKMGVPDQILLKPGPLTDEEWTIMRKHAVYAYDLLMPIVHLRPAIDIPYCHHERWDGKGYPRGLKGEDIPLSARIFAIVDVWDALRSDRPYRPALSREKTSEYIKNQSGSQFDPQITKLFLEAVATQTF